MNQANLPGTNTFATKSFEDRLLNVVEFDDALLDQSIWKNPRYDGCKAVSKEINAYTPTDNSIDTTLTSSGEYMGQYVFNEAGNQVWGGDITYSTNPVVQNETTAVYIVNTVIGGDEDKQFVTLKNHSYLGVEEILIINHETDEVQLLNRNVEGFEEFHRFLTNDLPTGESFTMKVLDKGIASNLKGQYRVKMNKGWLLKSFDFNFHPPTRHPSINQTCSLESNNTMYLYYSGSSTRNLFVTGAFNAASINSATGPQKVAQETEVRFRYGGVFMNASNVDNRGPMFIKANIGPSFASSSIVSNKFTRQFYSGSFGFIQDSFRGNFNNERLASSGLGSASKFIGMNCLDFLKSNVEDTTLTEQQQTEMHITFFQGTKDFAPGFHDERSISTFEIDQNMNSLDLGDHCNAFLPTTHELVLKGKNDHRFTPTLRTFKDNLFSVYLNNSSSRAYAGSGSFGCTHKDTVPGQFSLQDDGSGKHLNLLQPGVNQDAINNMECYVQGGALGPYGFQGDETSSGFDTAFPIEIPNDSTEDYGKSNNPSLAPYDGEATTDCEYSGSFNYEISFLDKDHTIIADVDKDAELFDGIGKKGLVLIPQHTHHSVKSNLDFYLKKAGLITEAPTTKVSITKQGYPFLSNDKKHKR